jgi:hypothetical protein
VSRKAAVLALLTLVVACGGEPAEPTTPPSTTTTTTGPQKLTLAGLVDDPCAAVTEGQTAALGVFFEGHPDVQNAHACNWGLNSGVLLFTPFPESDETARTPPAARSEISGRPAAQVRTGGAASPSSLSLPGSRSS